MPKRVVDGEGLWRSDKLARVQPPRWRAEYANLLPLALANGVFEANPRRIWSMVYAYNRNDVSPEDVEALLNELEQVKMLFRWTTPDGKVWGFWIGINRPGRLPGESRRKGKNEVVGPEPPQDQLRKFLDSNGFQELPNGNEKLLGSGSGSGIGSGSEVAPPNDGGAPSSAAIAFDAKKPRSRTKRKTKRSTKRKAEPTTAAWRLAQLLREEILINKPDSRITQADLTKWAITADVMLRRDKRSEECIAAMIRWAQADTFWKAIIRSVGKLRQHFDVLELRAGQKGVRANGRSLSDQAAESVAGAGKLIDSKAEELEQAFGGDIRGGGEAGS